MEKYSKRLIEAAQNARAYVLLAVFFTAIVVVSIPFLIKEGDALLWICFSILGVIGIDMWVWVVRIVRFVNQAFGGSYECFRFYTSINEEEGNF